MPINVASGFKPGGMSVGRCGCPDICEADVCCAFNGNGNAVASALMLHPNDPNATHKTSLAPPNH
jgi:hypothetical protein